MYRQTQTDLLQMPELYLTEYQEGIQAGFTKTFSLGDKNYQLIVTSLDYVFDCYSVKIKEL